MIKAGVPGATAAAQAQTLRGRTDPDGIALCRWLDQTAADQRSVAGLLDELPPTVALLHEVRLNTAAPLVDHLVVSAGGCFVVVGQRYDEPLQVLEHGLWSGAHPMAVDLERVQQGAVVLTQQLGVPVVPVVVVLGQALPPGAPLAESGVLVVAPDRLVRTLLTAAHTTLPRDQQVAIVESAAHLLANPASRVRPDRRSASRGTSLLDGPLPDVTPDAPPEQASAVADPTNEPVGRRRRLALVAMSAALTVAGAGGVLARLLSSGASAKAASTTGVPVTAPEMQSDAPLTQPPTVVPPMANGVTAPSVAFAPSCPVSGQGWTLTPLWPGELQNLAEYELEVRTLDGSWRRQGSFASPSETAGSALVGQQAGALFAARVSAVMIDGSVSVNSPTLVQVPKVTC